MYDNLIFIVKIHYQYRVQKLKQLMNKNNIKSIKYQINAMVHRLSLNKSISFDCKIVWRRSDNKSETSLKKHREGWTIFEQDISLTLNMVYNQQKQMYEQKNTQISVLISANGQIKSGGVAKFNAADLFNGKQKDFKRNIKLNKSPDPNAFVEITFTYQRIEEGSDEISVYHGESSDIGISRIEFNDDPFSIQMNRINQTIEKIQEFTQKTSKKHKLFGKIVQQNALKDNQISKLQKENEQLKKRLSKLQQSLSEKDLQLKEQKKKNQKQIQIMSEQIALKDKNKHEKNFKIQDSQNQNYKELYQNALTELAEFKQKSFFKGTMDMSKAFRGMDDVQDVANFTHAFQDQNQIHELTSINTQLQNQLASISHKMALIFNASYEYGGAKLLDYLQTSIGLTQSQM